MIGFRNFFRRWSGVQATLADPRRAAADAVAEKDAALKALFETGTAGISEVDLPSGLFVRVNRRFCEIMRRGADALLTMGPGDVIHPEDRDAVKLEWMTAMKTSGHWDAEVRHVMPDGGAIWVRIGVSVWKRSEAGVPIRCVAVLQDITESVRIKERLQSSEELLRLGQQIGRIGAFSRDLKTGLVYCGAETSAMCGLPPGQGPFAADVWFAPFVPEDRARVLETIRCASERHNSEIACEYRIRRRPDDEIRYLEMRARYLYDAAGRPIRAVGAVIDVTERKQTEERLAFAAKHDALTGLGNRTLFRECVNAATKRPQDGECFAIHCLDLDRFKEVNDTLGHPQGDRLLIETAGRLQQELSPGDTLARLGGDEFAIIQSNLRAHDDAGRLARRLVERISEPFTLAGQRVTIGASVGVAIAPRDGAHYEELMSAADLALYQAKAQATRGWRYFEPQMQARAQMRRELERDLREALEKGEFQLFYQPILDVKTLQVSRFEALIRWLHPERGIVPPDKFIPITEETGMIVPLGAWVLQQACKQAMSWPETIGIAVNISAVQVAAGNLDLVASAALVESGLAPERLELEITETSLLKDSETTLEVLRKLKTLGVRIAMDDFGAGHSSIGYLQSFPFDKVKIDRAFARALDGSCKSAAIVKALIDLCEALEIPTTIEGVETDEQFRAIAEMGGKEVQGYLFSPPRPADCALSLLAQFGGVPELLRAAE